MNSKAIGQKVRTLRSKQGLTTTTLAKKVRLSQAQVSRLENGLQGWRSATLMKFAKALKVKPVYFLVAGEEVNQTRVAKELDSLGLAASDGLIRALRDKKFLRFMEKCARAMRAHKKNLVRTQKAMKRAGLAPFC